MDNDGAPEMSTPRREELFLSVEAALRGDISHDDAERLQDLLRDEETLKQYVGYVLGSASLGVWAATLNESEDFPPMSASQSMESLPLAPTGQGIGAGDAEGRPQPGRGVAKRRLRQLRSYGRIAAAATVLVTAVIVWSLSQETPRILPERERQPVASVAADHDARWQDDIRPHDASRLMEGQRLSLVAGRAQVSMSCGADLILKAPCSVVLTSPKQIQLQDGLVSVQVADWADGFTVVTESVHIVDLGKRFVVSADSKTGAVEAHAIDGRLRVQTTNVPEEQRRGLLVASGEAIRIHPATNVSTRLKANGKLFDQDLERAQPFKPLAIHNTGVGLTPGDEDPHWRIVASTADDFRGPRYATVCRPYQDVYLPNDPGVSQWVSVGNPVDVHDCPPNTMYTFETEFDLTGFDISTVTLVAHVLVDNGITGIRVNGRSVEFKAWIDTVGLYNSFHKLEINDGIVEGVNRIQFDVWNGIVVRDVNASNPMAFRVEWQAFGRLAPKGAEGDAARLDGEHIAASAPSPPRRDLQLPAAGIY